MTIEGARAFAEDLSVEEYRLVHLSHYIAAEDAFDDDMALDGEQFVL
jgi:phosphoribosyl 1,2-cyclic phosphate phosphodiesterase